MDISIETLLWITAFATTATAGASLGIYWTLRRLGGGTRDWEALSQTAELRASAEAIPRLPAGASVAESLRFIACAQRTLVACQMSLIRHDSEPEDWDPAGDSPNP